MLSDGNLLALDCEMVGTGPRGSVSALGRVSLVSDCGQVVYDSYVQPLDYVTDYRTKYSGITPRLLATAKPYSRVVNELDQLIAGATLVGFDMRTDLALLGLRAFPRIKDLRKFSSIPEFSRDSLKTLSRTFLNVSIQNGPHDSVQDAQATMALYFYHRWRINRVGRQYESVRIRGNAPVIVENLYSHDVDEGQDDENEQDEGDVYNDGDEDDELDGWGWPVVYAVRRCGWGSAPRRQTQYNAGRW